MLVHIARAIVAMVIVKMHRLHFIRMSCSSRFDGAYFVELKRATPSLVDGSDYRDDSCQFPADTVIMQRRCHCTFSALPKRI
jgi:hypothetical protein